MKTFNYFTALVAALSLFSACKKSVSDESGNNSAQISKIAPDNFSFKTTKQVDVSIKLMANDNTPLKGVPVSLAAPSNQVNYSGADLFKAVTDANGMITASITVPSYLDTLVIKPSYTGIIQDSKALIRNSGINVTLGGTGLYSGIVTQSTKSYANFKQSAPNMALSATGMSFATTDLTTYSYMGTFDNMGAPTDYKVTPDVITSTLMTYLNASLPERIDVRTLHPNYITSGTTSDIKITQTATVWITFVYEGAGNYNSIGYYTYPTNTPPQTAADIKQIYYMFPNSSMPGSGGNLAPGTKISLGTINAGTSVGFVLFASGWTGSAVKSSVNKHFSTSNLNPEPGDLARHTVLLNDSKDGLFLIGFEDLNRTYASCDQDFNDVVIYATSNPITAISTTNVAPIDEAKDTDGDGVIDVFDAFPADPTRAYITYLPSKDNWGTLAYEDQWPSKGDYDMNDLVVNYRYQIVSNAQNKVVEMTGDYTLLAAGASFNNGFGVQFPFAASVVKQVSGQSLTQGYIKTAASGVESGQKNAVIIPFDSYRNMFHTNAYLVNTIAANSKLASDTVHVYMQFNTPITTATLGAAPFNPFLISNGRRSYEVHLPGSNPTDLADPGLFGTQDDNSIPTASRYYLTKENYPWAISFYQPFAYPTEGSVIWSAYPHFLDWAQTGGTSYTDWYTSILSGYRKTDQIYSK